MSGFQKQVNRQQAPAVAGDFASANPRASVLAGEAGLVAGASGVTVGKFAWVASDGVTTYNYGTNPNAPNGFVHREQQGLITTWLAESTMTVPQGLPVVLHNEGDFFAVNAGASASTVGGAVYAKFSDGSIAVGAVQTGASVTGSMGSTCTASLGATFTASADTDPTRLVVTAVTGLISVGAIGTGDVASGTGITAGTTILSQVSGTSGGAGTYQLSATNTASSATVTCFGKVVKVTVRTGLISIGEVISGGTGFPVGATIATQVSGTAGDTGVYTISAPGTAYTASASGVTTFGNVVNVTAIGSGVLAVGDPMTGSGIPASSVIATFVSGVNGGIGIYTLNNNATAYAASTTLTVTAGILTSYKAQNIAAVGELVKISTWG